MNGRREADLYGPIKAFLQELGYEVKGEVNDCDLVGVRGDDLVVVELKKAFNLALVLQGIERQKVTDAVYVAVEAPRTTRGEPRWSEVQGLCRRLGLGLMTVAFTRNGPVVQVMFDPAPYQPRKSPKDRALLLTEFRRRSGDFNTGGVTRRPIVTAYREEALVVAAFLRSTGAAAPKAVRAGTGVARAAAILQQDYYGWFERVEKGIYRLSPKGEQALAVYADVVGER